MVLSSWQGHCKSSPGSFDECRLSAGWPPTLRPNQPVWAVSLPKDWLLPSADTIAIYYYYSAHKLILMMVMKVTVVLMLMWRYDFFLVSQSVRQGTVAPTHYNVIHDTTQLKPDHMQRLAYKLCHLYYNWPVSLHRLLFVPSPAISCWTLYPHVLMCLMR